MPTDEAERFVRVNYDDRRKCPWVVMWGIDHVWRCCQTKERADETAKRLQDMCDVFHDWAWNLRKRG